MLPMGDVLAQRLHDVVSKGELGVNYTFAANRDKNKELRRKYNVNDAKMKEILLEITGTHFVKSEVNENIDHTDDMVHIFKIKMDLMPRFVEEASYIQVCIYVKVTWPDSEEPMFIISFHEDEE